MTRKRPLDPMNGITLQMMLERLVAHLGWDTMAQEIPVRCFTHDPSISSSLKFLRKTPWARTKVEWLYRNERRRMRPPAESASAISDVPELHSLELDAPDASDASDAPGTSEA